MSTHSYAGIVFDTSVVVGPDDGGQQEFVTFSYVGKAGIERKPKGWRGQRIRLAGMKTDPEIGTLLSWKLQVEERIQDNASVTQTDRLVLYDGREEWENVMLESFTASGIRRHTNGYALLYTAEFVQLAPNGEDMT